MNLISVLNKRRRRRGLISGSAVQHGNDHVLARRMRKAAVGLRTDGRTELRLTQRTAEGIRRVGERAETIRRGCIDGGEALKRLVQDCGLMEACAQQARTDRIGELPAAGHSARIECVLKTLCGDGDLRLTEERLLLGIASFDDVQPLETAEMWAVPQAVRIVLCKSYQNLASMALEIAEERRLAERWVSGMRVNPAGRSPAFFEHALHLLSERGKDGRHAALEQCAADMGTNVQKVIQQVHSQESLICMRMENIVSAKRLVDGLDWQACFEMLSSVEQELSSDPSGVYASMEDDSRAAVRAQVAVLARRMGLAELTVARHAVRAAQLAAGENECEARRTVCYWLYDDTGRRELVRRMGGAGTVLPRIVPDPSGIKATALIAALFAACYGLYLGATRNIWFSMMGIPLAWQAAMSLLGRIFPKCVKPAKLLKIKLGRVPDALRTLVVMPVLLLDVERARVICDHIEALGCLETDENIRYLILGDFADADAQHVDGDEEITAFVRKRISKMNLRAGREQYFYLHRDRSLLKRDSRWMGRDRKRGALMDLNRLLMGENGSEEAFAAEGEACARLAGRFRYVLTLDEDTRFLPGTVQRLIGALAHPMNRMRTEDGVRRGYAVVQPQMEMAADACVNGFVRMFAGAGGVSSYPGSVSGFWQDVTGMGLFGGKGLYDVHAFHAALDGALPEGRILSHDLIEGMLAGAAQVSDICFCDGHPASMGGYLKRMNRWIRGDWQLLPLLVSGRKYPVRERSLTVSERIRLLDNLLRSLWAPSLIGLLMQAVWMNHSTALAVGMLLAFLTPVLNGGGSHWQRAAAELTVLPAYAACAADAVVRTLWRLLVTQRHLLDWVTSADAEKGTSNPKTANRVAAILLMPGLLIPEMLPVALALGALFWMGPGWMRALEEEAEEAEIEAEDAGLFVGIARDTWKYFESSVTEQNHFLPPDNVQLAPDVGMAGRTSPTNIGLYLMSCIAAHRLGFIGKEELEARVDQTVKTMERMEKWKGHLYNWYDIDRLKPLRPNYVSSVDSGNLAASLLLCASALGECPLAVRMRSLAESMDFTALYDSRRELFRIGADTEHGRMSEAHYDLLASESRILSYTAMMLGQIPIRHWTRLGRPAASLREGSALVSWSGTMFEYLMPELYMHAPGNTLLGSAVRTAVQAQRRLGREKKRPWGVSESGFSALDMRMNYQYRAFGLRALSMSGQAVQDVVAPYATALASTVAPAAAALNFRRMEALGWRGPMGFYEAADYLHAGPDGKAQVVKSYMAHHQGMILCALCSLLADRSLNRDFMAIPQAQALALLLQERSVSVKRSAFRRKVAANPDRSVENASDDCLTKPQRRMADVHLLGGGGAAALLTAKGMIYYMKDGRCVAGESEGFQEARDWMCVYVLRERTSESAILGGQAAFFPGGARIQCSVGPVKCEMKIALSPEDGTLLKRILLKNTSDSEETVRVMDFIPVGYDRNGDRKAQYHLFEESERPSPQMHVFRSRSCAADGRLPVLAHLISAPGRISCETDCEKIAGHSGLTMQSACVEGNLSDTAGAVLQTVLTIAPEETVELHFAQGLMESEELDAWREHSSTDVMAERVLSLSALQSRAMVDFLNLDQQKTALLSGLAALMFAPTLCGKPNLQRRADGSFRCEELKDMGISGEWPLLVVYADSPRSMQAVRDALCAHEYYRTLGVQTDLVLVAGRGGEDVQPVLDAVRETVGFSSLNNLRGECGGVRLLEGTELNAEQRRALHRAAALEIHEDFYAQIRSALADAEPPKHPMRKTQAGEKTMPMTWNGGRSCFGGSTAERRRAADVRRDHSAAVQPVSAVCIPAVDLRRRQEML